MDRAAVELDAMGSRSVAPVIKFLTVEPMELVVFVRKSLVLDMEAIAYLDVTDTTAVAPLSVASVKSETVDLTEFVVTLLTVDNTDFVVFLPMSVRSIVALTASPIKPRTVEIADVVVPLAKLTKIGMRF